MPNRAVSKVVENREFLVCMPDDSVQTVAAHMRQHGEGAVLIVSAPGAAVMGICTERDLAFKVLAEGLNAGKTPIRQVMTANPLTISPEKPFSHALHMMHEGGFRHMPVVDAAGKPLGIVSARDALGLEAVSFAHEMAHRELLSEIL